MRGKINGPQKIVIYGPEGIGKSTFASQFPSPVFIDTEGSTKHMDVARTPRPSSWSMLLDQVEYFRKTPGEYKTLVIDTADWAEQLCVNHLVAKAPNAREHGLGGIEGFGYGKGYTYLAEEFGRLLNLLEDVILAGMNVAITAHAQMRKFEQPDEVGSYDRWELKLQKKTAPLLKEWADMVLFANYKTYVVNVDGKGTQKGKNKVQGGRRVMYTAHHNCWDAKNRHGLPEELPFAYDEIAHCIVASKASGPMDHPVSPKETKTVKVDEPVDMALTPKSASDKLTTETYKEIKHIFPDQNAKTPTAIPLPDGIPRALQDLMRENNVTTDEIQKAVASKGYYPKDTPIKNYDPAFVAGVLVGAWQQVYKMIQEMRELPFMQQSII